METRVETVDSKHDDWLERALSALDTDGVVVVDDVLSAEQLDRLEDASYRAELAIIEEIGLERLRVAGETGVLRLPMKYDSTFLELFEVPELLAIVDATVGDAAICHLQNGLILPSTDQESEVDDFQHRWHRDFPRYLNGYLASLNTFFCLSEFDSTTGATRFARGSHQQASHEPPRDTTPACVAQAARGSLIAFDSTIWHCAGHNRSGRDRLAVNQQWTVSWIKQQIDYVRALGPDLIAGLPDRTQQLLGWYTRVVTSLNDYYQPSERRLYRAGQG